MSAVTYSVVLHVLVLLRICGVLLRSTGCWTCLRGSISLDIEENDMDEVPDVPRPDRSPHFLHSQSVPQLNKNRLLSI